MSSFYELWSRTGILGDRPVESGTALASVLEVQRLANQPIMEGAPTGFVTTSIPLLVRTFSNVDFNDYEGYLGEEEFLPLWHRFQSYLIFEDFMVGRDDAPRKLLDNQTKYTAQLAKGMHEEIAQILADNPGQKLYFKGLMPRHGCLYMNYDLI